MRVDPDCPGRILGVGTDIIETRRFLRMAEEVAEGGPEGRGCADIHRRGAGSRQGRLGAQHLASRFAVKEAVMKCLGCGMDRIGFTEIEVVSGEDGRPAVRLYGRARARADALGVHDVMLSLSHTEEFACAFAIAVGGASDDSDQPGSSP